MMFDLPPPEFDHGFAGQIIEYRMTAGELDIACGRGTMACAVKYSPNLCLIATPIVGPGGVSHASYVIFRRHEIGHCNGWHHQ